MNTLINKTFVSLLLATLMVFANTTTGRSAAASGIQPLDGATLDHVKDLFHQLMERANKHDVDATLGQPL